FQPAKTELEHHTDRPAAAINIRQGITKAQRHQERRQLKPLMPPFLVSLCLCVFVIPHHCHWLPRCSLTPNIARRGSVKTMGRPKFGLNRSSVASSSSALSLSTLSTSTSNSIRADSRVRIVLDTRMSSSDCDDNRREPRGSS